MLALSAVSVALFAYVVWQAHSISRERERLLSEFAAEREIWVRERRDLNNRIQVPEAAAFMVEEDGPSDDDLPVLPEFTVDAEEFERAKAELEAVGYSEGPAA